ncbi:hypothetical protein [Microscilla marina]|uniref:Uncharacterized protein n=1 Tax=Microscilla marina ATCC 23134 TaxID=313606 RepID=A1ZFB6_MICM2|nr:hypothetical protein [Microscilla marina]EAY30690.1 hypothetical protein M23134_01014 [Microscilla marina ATCC 23134]
MPNQHHKQKQATQLWAHYNVTDERVFWKNYEALLTGNEKAINDKLQANTSTMMGVYRPPWHAYVWRVALVVSGIAAYLFLCMVESEPLPESLRPSFWIKIVVEVIIFGIAVVTPISLLLEATVLEITDKSMVLTSAFVFTKSFDLENIEQIQVIETYNSGIKWSHDLLVITADKQYTFSYFLNKKRHWQFLDFWKSQGVSTNYEGSHYYGWKNIRKYYEKQGYVSCANKNVSNPASKQLK